MFRCLPTICLLSLLAICAQAVAQPKLNVEVTGLEGELERNVRAFLTIEQQKAAEDLTAQRIRRYHARAPGEIRTALQPFGYYQPLIEGRLEQENDAWTASYTVNVGPPILITTLDVQISGPGKDDPNINAVIESLPVKVGSRLVHADYERAKYQLQTTALNNGYRDAVYERHEIRVIRPANQAEITLHLSSGNKHYFGPVTFQGSKLREELLRAYIPFADGDPWSNKKLLEFKRALVDSNYFDIADVVPRQDLAQADDRIPIEVKLTPRKKNRYSIGLGYATDTGPRLTLNWQRRQLNRRGHRLEIGSETSQIRQSVTSKYSIPLSRPRTDVLDFIGSWRRDDTDTTKSTIEELRASHGSTRGKLQRTVYLSYKREDYEVGNDDDEFSTLVIPGASLTLVHADSRLITRKGYRLQLEVKGSGNVLASDTTFVQGLLQGKTIFPMGKRGRWVMRADLGGTGLSSVDGLPASNRFFAGGDQSIRGYDYQDLGPEDNQGKVTGGTGLLVGSLEYNHRVTKKWHGAVFYDAGNAFNDLPIDVKHGAGIGVRWESPVGMVRVDVAAALDKEDNPWRLHVSFGPDL